MTINRTLKLIGFYAYGLDKQGAPNSFLYLAAQDKFAVSIDEHNQVVMTMKYLKLLEESNNWLSLTQAGLDFLDKLEKKVAARKAEQAAKEAQQQLKKEGE